MSADGQFEIPQGGCHMCLAIPGKVIEIASDNPNSALVDVEDVSLRIGQT